VNSQNVLRKEKSKIREKEPSANTAEDVRTSWASAPLPPPPFSAPSAAAYQISSWLAATTTQVVIALRMGSDSNRIWKCSAYTCDWGLERRKDSRLSSQGGSSDDNLGHCEHIAYRYLQIDIFAYLASISIHNTCSAP
jgi:hypothetical protein